VCAWRMRAARMCMSAARVVHGCGVEVAGGVAWVGVAWQLHTRCTNEPRMVRELCAGR